MKAVVRLLPGVLLLLALDFDRGNLSNLQPESVGLKAAHQAHDAAENKSNRSK